MEKAEYRRAISETDQEAHQRLRYDANLREGAIEPNSTGRLTDRFENSPNGFNIGVHIDGELASAMRMHVLSKKYPESTLRQNYPDVVDDLVEQDHQIIDITRLAANYPISRKFPHLLYVTVRLSMMAAEHFQASLILAGVRAEHIPFYKREFLATPLTEPRPYPTLIKKLALFKIDYWRDAPAIVKRHPFYASTKEERWKLFGDPAALLP